MAINFRDPADKVGAALGFVIGIILTVMVLTANPFEGLILNGLTLPKTPFIEIITFLLLIGICVNLTRNLFVGAHDAAVFLIHLCRRKKS